VLKKYLIVDGGGECDYSIMSCASASPAPQRWYRMHWVDSMHQDAGRKDHIISHQHHFVVIYILPNQSHPLQKWCQSPQNRRYTTSPVQEYCSVTSRLAIFQRARLNSLRWQWYNVGFTHPIIWDIKTVAISHFRGCIIYHTPNAPTIPLNPWFYPSSAMYWYVGALGAWIIRLLRRYLHKFCHNCKYIRQNHTSN
jgi:hypothetical protein